VALEAAATKEPMKQRRPRVDWAEALRRMFDFDVFACVRCGGRRRLLAYVMPHVPYHQWTLSFPHRVRWVLL